VRSAPRGIVSVARKVLSVARQRRSAITAKASNTVRSRNRRVRRTLPLPRTCAMGASTSRSRASDKLFLAISSRSNAATLQMRSGTSAAERQRRSWPICPKVRAAIST
jgi:hypothetical protein